MCWEKKLTHGVGPGGPGGQKAVHEPAMAWWPRRPKGSWGSLGRALPAGQGKSSCPSTQPW